MIYDQSEGLLKNGSLTARIYFLLLKKPLTVSDLSRIIYNGKVQLAHINRIIDVLLKEGYIEECLISRDEKRIKGIDLRTRYWKSTYKPVIEYIKVAVSERKKGSQSIRKEYLTSNDEKLLQVILNSKWFSNFYKDEFLKTQHGEITSHNGTILSATPIRFFAFMLEQLFAIRMTLKEFSNFPISEEEIIEEKDFDRFVGKHKHLVTSEIKRKISLAIRRAKRNLGDYDSTNISIDYYMNDYSILFIPYPIAAKAYAIGRVPLTVFIAFNSAMGHM